MSEVTAKDLRDELKDLMDSQITEYSQRHYPQECVLMQERIDRFLAAFDAMAEKAETLRLLESQLAQGARLRRQGDDMEEEYGDYAIYIPLRYGGKHYSGKTLAEALKAVKE